jgi:hypothetical protein
MPEIAPDATTAPLAPLKTNIHVVKDVGDITKKTANGTSSNEDLH